MPVNDFTIIDITDPESSAYCFAFPEKTPLSATQYVRNYYPEPTSVSETDQTNEIDEAEQKLEQSVLAALHPFESLPMVTIDMLAEAWPGEYMPGEPNHSGLSPKPKESSPSVHMLPSLVDLTFVPAINRALQTGEADHLDPLIWQPGNPPKIKEILRVHNPLSAADFALLSKVIPFEVKQTKTIDLSHFSMTGDQVLKLVSAQEGVEVLDLSHMQQITADTLRELLPTLPNLRRLVLLHTISDSDILSLLSESPKLFYGIESFIHLAFLRPLGEAAFPPAFSHIIAHRRRVWITSLPYFTVDQLVQGLIDFHSPFAARDPDSNHAFHCDDCEVPILAAYASEVRGPGRSWSERIVPFIPAAKPERFNKPKCWFLVWTPELLDDPRPSYAFVRFNKEAMEECRRRINEIRSLPRNPDKPRCQAAAEPDANVDDISRVDTFLSDQELHAQEEAIKSEYTDREYQIFDIESFFQELVKEGRPAPSPEALTKLLEIFVILQRKDRRRPLCLMTQADLSEFLDYVSRHY